MRVVCVEGVIEGKCQGRTVIITTSSADEG